jgi:hypothetical protein
MKIHELVLPKNSWEVLTSPNDKEDITGNLIDLVKTAYSTTPQGSFVNSIRDVMPSHWHVIDWDKQPDVDACIFYRRARGSETWKGIKLQGIGHDGQPQSKQKALDRLQTLLQQPGVWIETSDALRAVLLKMSAPVVEDVKVIQKLFGDQSIEMVSSTEYKRQLSTGEWIQETVFGIPMFQQLIESELFEISSQQHNDINKAGASLFKSLDIKFHLSDHAVKRSTDSRENNNPIKQHEIINMLKQLIRQERQYLKSIADGKSFVAYNPNTLLNMTFVCVVDYRINQKILHVPTVMRTTAFKLGTDQRKITLRQRNEDK